MYPYKYNKSYNRKSDISNIVQLCNKSMHMLYVNPRFGNDFKRKFVCKFDIIKKHFFYFSISICG